MKRSFRGLRLVGFLSALLCGAAAQALTLHLDDCDSFGCQGSEVSLSVLAAGGGDWDVTLALDSTGYTGSKTGVVQAGFKAIQGFSSVSLVSYTDGSWSPAVEGGVSSGSLCALNSNSDFVCSSGYAEVQSNTQSSWLFRVSGGTVLDEWTIKYQYGNTEPDPNGRYNGQIISAPGRPGGGETPVPEPSAALVFAAGLLVAGRQLRRTR